ncbi:MAG: GNAT family N-acetyltransferase, partial [Planctomycetota bacterium]
MPYALLVLIAQGELDRADVLETMREHSPPCRAHALPAEALAAPAITFFTVRDDDEARALLGCGALKEISGGTAGEIKSMRTATAHLRRGVAAFLLQHLI